MCGPGGFVEHCTDTWTRPPAWVALPKRGPFTFPAPYHTTGILITHPTDMGGGDALHPCGYSYWANMNAHTTRPEILVFLGTNRQRGGPGPSLWSIDKATDQVRPLGPIFPPDHPLSWSSGEGWYWSATDPDLLYASDLEHLYRINVTTKDVTPVVDISVPPFGGSGHVLWQWHSSNDGRTHSATVKNATSYRPVGTIVYREHSTPTAWTFYAAQGQLDESQVDPSGEWLVIKDNVDGHAGEDNRIVRIATGETRVLLDQHGAAGHSDSGYGYMVAADNWNDRPGAVRLWMYDGGEPQGRLVYHSTSWNAELNHVSHLNARPGRPEGQYAIGSGASHHQQPRNNEIVAFRLDGSLRVVVIAPTLTDLTRGERSSYDELPKGNVDVTGQYFLWTSNAGRDRLDAFVVKVPSHHLAW